MLVHYGNIFKQIGENWFPLYGTFPTMARVSQRVPEIFINYKKALDLSCIEEVWGTAPILSQ